MTASAQGLNDTDTSQALPQQAQTLHLHSWLGDFATIKRVVNRDNVNKQDGRGNTLLNLVMHSTLPLSVKVEIAQYLLWIGANPNTPNLKGEYPLGGLFYNHPCDCVSLDLVIIDNELSLAVKLFAENGATLDFYTRTGYSPLTYCIANALAMTAEVLLDRNAGANYEDRNHILPLQAVWQCSNFEYFSSIFKLLIEKGADTTRCNTLGQGFRHPDVMRNCPDELESRVIGIINDIAWKKHVKSLFGLFLNEVAWASEVPKQGHNRYSVSWTSKVCEKITLFFISKMSEEGGTYYLHRAVEKDRPHLVNACLSLGISPNAKCTKGCTPLTRIFEEFEGCFFDKMTTLKLLLEKGGIFEVDSKEVAPLIPALFAPFKGEDPHRINLARKWFVMMMLKYNVKANCAFKGISLLNFSIAMFASRFQPSYLSLASTLIRYGVDPNLPDERGVLPLQVALCCLQTAQTVPRALEIIYLIKEMLLYGANPHIKKPNSPYETYMRSRCLRERYPQLEAVFNHKALQKPPITFDDSEIELIYKSVQDGPLPFKVEADSHLVIPLGFYELLCGTLKLTSTLEKELHERGCEAKVTPVAIFNPDTASLTYLYTMIKLEVSDQEVKDAVVNWLQTHKEKDDKGDDKSALLHCGPNVVTFISSEQLAKELRSLSKAFRVLFNRRQNSGGDQAVSSVPKQEDPPKNVDPRTPEMVATCDARKTEADAHLRNLKEVLTKKPGGNDLRRRSFYENALLYFTMRALETLRIRNVVTDIEINFPVDIRTHFDRIQIEDVEKIAQKLTTSDILASLSINPQLELKFDPVRERTFNLNINEAIHSIYVEIQTLLPQYTKDLISDDVLQGALEMCLIRMAHYLNSLRGNILNNEWVKKITKPQELVACELYENVRIVTGYTKFKPEMIFSICRNLPSP